MHTRWNFPYHYQHSVGKLHSTRCYSWWIIVNRYESLLIIRDTIISNEWPLHAWRHITCIAIDIWSCSWLFNVRYVDLEVSLQFHVRNVNLRTLPLNGSCGCLLHTNVVESGGTWATCLGDRSVGIIKCGLLTDIWCDIVLGLEKKSEELIVSQQVIKAWSRFSVWEMYVVALSRSGDDGKTIQRAPSETILVEWPEE